jgi:pimeloyl-ACP methyl ester carboxylesterase
MTSAISHQFITLKSVRLHTASAGQGSPVVLLHGFPEFWYSWRKQIPTLAENGYEAIAPDLRGYNESSHPPGVAEYRAKLIVQDIAELIRTLPEQRAFVVGHDWGGVIAWRLAALHPELVRKLVILNAPHPAHYRRTLGTNPMQWLRSSYAGFFQLPYLPERLISAGDLALLERVFRRETKHADAFTADDIAQYKQAMRRGLTEPLNYYRAATRYPADLFGPPQEISVPTLVIWGERDPYLSVQLSRGLEHYVRDLRIKRLPDIGHWVQNDAAEEVNGLLLDFLDS